MVTLYSIFQSFIKQTKIYIQNVLPKKVSELTNDVGYITSHQDISGKQDKLTFDTTPMDGSTNPVTSDGVKKALDNKQDKTGTAVSATKLSTARTIQTNLASTTATAFDGSANITPGVTGTLSVSNGGTGTTNLDNVTVGTSKKVHTTVSSDTVGELVKATMGDNDAFRIAVGGGANAGFVELATADDGTEPIYVRQYADAKTDGFITPTRTATLLDAGGNTSFPGKVTAPTFSGSLNGNADTANTIKDFVRGTVNAFRNVWFSDNTNNAKPVYNEGIQYNPSTNVLKTGTFQGTLNGNADTATTANTATNANHASNADSATNADKVDGYHENSFLRYRGVAAATGEDTLWNQIGIKEYDKKLPKGVSGTYNYGAAVSLPGGGTRLDIWYNHQCSANGDGLWYRSGWDTDQKPWARLLDSNNYTNWAPTKTGSGASGTWGINITGNAASATNSDKVDGYHASDLLGKIYPVGSIYMSMSATNPHDLFGVGTWKRISQGRMLLGADDSTYKAGATGGEATHTLTAAEMPAHSHGISTSGDHSHYFYGSDSNNGPLTEGDGLDTEENSHFTRNVRFTTSSAGAHTHTISNAGGGAAHNNMPPYLVCYIWQRTA